MRARCGGILADYSLAACLQVPAPLKNAAVSTDLLLAIDREQRLFRRSSLRILILHAIEYKLSLHITYLGRSRLAPEILSGSFL